mmetsp:Transcript_12367/g.15428  ORF Transcript_12367/g.15428 Transcript_12367/m.15428 type:complete len:293 (-) Transcript_12367:199-1077(-)|eukprot:CAMPEP_0172508216 /NCGR_PEP_ID=MMETSP1066-20121228/210247_1 /TAXON_ID=671091 /ORGANISM="Coscinodiscus wailesii, Strain CCMP2513" /LENGTH=292 /DNA_ID=CAMNT_0013286103 /DNA_START=39 /DNA_END=917 /DNA_ORIENTATION=-
MPTTTSGLFSVDVLVGNKLLNELECPDGAPAADAYVETMFNAPVTYKQMTIDRDPYGEEFESYWPVTPYTLQVKNNASYDVRALVYIDGMKAAGYTVRSRRSTVIQGYQSVFGDCYSKITEFLFCLPRATSSSENFNNEEYGTIKVNFHRQSDETPTRYGDGADTLKTLNIDKKSASIKGIGTISGSGKTIQDRFKPNTARRIKVLEKVDSLLVRYETNYRLRLLGIIANKNYVVDENDSDVEIVKVVDKKTRKRSVCIMSDNEDEHASKKAMTQEIENLKARLSKYEETDQ